jgi:hypothetical protein
LIRGVLYNDINTELLRASDGALNKKGVEAFFSLLEQRKTPLAVLTSATLGQKSISVLKTPPSSRKYFPQAR